MSLESEVTRTGNVHSNPSARVPVDIATEQASARRQDDSAAIAAALAAAEKHGAPGADNEAAPAETPAAEAEAAGAPAADAAATPAAEAEAKEIGKVEKAKRESLLAIAREEKRLQEARRADKAEKAAIAAEREAMKAQLAELEEYKAAKADPLKVLEKAGYTLDQTLEHAIKGGKGKEPTPEERVKAIVNARLEALEAKRAEAAAKEAEAAAARQKTEQAAWYAAESVKAKKLVEASGEKYELVRAYGAHEKLLHVREYAFRNGDESMGIEPGTRLSLDKCAEIVESFIEQDLRAKFASTKKLSSLLGGKPAEQVEARPSTGEKAKPAPTLSNRKATSTATPSEERRALSDSEALEEATKMLKFKSSR